MSIRRYNEDCADHNTDKGLPLHAYSEIGAFHLSPNTASSSHVRQNLMSSYDGSDRNSKTPLASLPHRSSVEIYRQKYKAKRTNCNDDETAFNSDCDYDTSDLKSDSGFADTTVELSSDMMDIGNGVIDNNIASPK